MANFIDRISPETGREQILRTWSASFPELPTERYRWIYQENPAGAALCWIAGDDADPNRIIGAAALLRRRFAINGVTEVAGISADYSVMPGHRGFGPALGLQRQAAAAADDAEVAFVYGLPNPKARPLLRRVGFATIGNITQFTRVLKTRGVLERRLSRHLLPQVLAPLADLALDLSLMIRSLFRRRRSFRAVEPPEFDERFDRLWEDVRTRHAILGERSAEFLTWRFGKSPHAQHRTFALSDPGSDSLVGYVVYHERGDRTIIDDVLCQDLGETLDTLLLRFARRRRAQGSASIAVSFFGNGQVVQALKRNGFSVRDASDPVVLYVRSDSTLSDLLASPGNWYLFKADNDI